MKLQFAPGFPADNWCGALGLERFEFERGPAPFECSCVHGEALLRVTWRKRTEVPVEGQDKPRVLYSDEPVFARIEEAAAGETESKRRPRKAETPVSAE